MQNIIHIGIDLNLPKLTFIFATSMTYFTFSMKYYSFWSGLRQGLPVYCCIELMSQRSLRHSCIFDFLIDKELQMAYNQVWNGEQRLCIWHIDRHVYARNKTWYTFMRSTQGDDAPIYVNIICILIKLISSFSKK